MLTYLVGEKPEERVDEFFPGEDKASLKLYGTIGDALAALENEDRHEGARILILPGTYEENLSITRWNLTVRGAGQELVKITGSLGGYEILEDGLKRGTFRTQTVFVHADDVRIVDLTIENRAGQGHEVGQAIALYVDGDRFYCQNVTLFGHQDTLFLSPLPEKEMEPGGFRGPLEHAPRINGRQFYRWCKIYGTVDFIFGSATAYFEECEIISLDQERPSQVGYVTAPSTPKGQELGFVFYHCILKGECPKETVFLGRPWRDYGQAVFLACELDGHIKPEGWDDWGKPGARKSCFFAEYGCIGEGSSLEKRVPFARTLTQEEALCFTKERIF